MRVFLIAYEGKEKETGKVFEKVDEKEPFPIIAGGKDVFEKIENVLSKMKVGEEKEVELEPKEGFGERKDDLVVLIPEKEFKKRGITPVPGLVVDADGMKGRVMSVSSGRVLVDFNHPLAGKTVVYKIKLVGIEEGENAVKKVFKRFFGYEPEEVKIDKDKLFVSYLPGKGNKAGFVAKMLQEFKEVVMAEKFVRAESGAGSGQ